MQCTPLSAQGIIARRQSHRPISTNLPMIDVHLLTRERIADAEAVFASMPAAQNCWCMWFIIPVKEFHAHGGALNRDRFGALLETDPHPLGLLAYSGDLPVGWCATGPRTRFVRGIKTPSFKGRDPEEDDRVWLVPCFLVRPVFRGRGVARALLEGAVALAAANGATAIEGFPFAGSDRRSAGDMQVGVEPLFASAGFAVVRRPSDTRVVVRREL